MEQGPEMKDVSPEAGSAPVIQDGACPQPAEELSNPEKTPFPDVAMETATAEDCSEPALRIETSAEDSRAGRKRPREDADEVAEPRAACDVPESGNGSLGGVGCVVSAAATQPATAGSTGGQHAAAPPTAATLAPDSAVRPTLGGVGSAGPPPFLPMLPMMLMGMGMPIFPGIGPGARAPLMPPAFMPALCQLLLVYVQRVKQLTGQPQQQHPDDAGAAKPHSTAPGTSPAAPGQSPPDTGAPPAAAPPPPDQRAGAKPAAALADHRPEQRPEPQQQPPAVVAVSQLQEFGIPVPSLLQAAAHLMVVGALSPVQYQEVQAKLGPIAAQEGQAALAADCGASVAAAAVAAAAAAAAVRATGPAATAAAGTLGASHVAPAAASVLTPAAAAALAAAGGSGLLQPAASAPAVAGAPGALAKATPVVPAFTAKVDPAQRQPPEASPAEPGLLPTVSWPGRGGAQAPFRLGLGRRLFCAVADQLPTSTELDCILPPMYGFSGVLYRMKDSAEVGAALWDGAVVRDLGPYTSAQDARQSIVMSIKLLAAANAAAPQPSGPAYTYGGALPGAPSLRSGPSVRSGGLRAAAVAAGAAAPPPLGGGARREPPPSGPMRDGVAGLGGHGDGLGRGGSRGVRANGRSGLGLGLPAVGSPGSGPGLPGAGPGGVGPDPAEADVLEAADQLLKLRSEGSGRIHMSNSPEPLPVVVAPAAAGVTALGGLVGAELGAPPLPPAVAAQLVAAPGKQRSLSALATADDPIILSPGLTAAAPTGVGLAGLQHLADAGVGSGGGGKSSRTGSGSGRSGGAVAADEPQGPTVTGRLASRTPSSLSQARQPPAGPLAASPRHLGSLHVRAFAAAAANPTLPEAAGARAPTPSWAQQEHQRRDVAPVVDLTMTDVDTRSSVQQSPRGTNRMTPLVLKPGGGASQVGSEAAALVALISSGRLQDMDRAELEALVAGSSGPALLAALQSLPQDLVAAATAAESGAGGHALEADKGERPGQAGAAPSQRQQQQSVELRRGPGWDDGDGQPAGGSAGLPRRGRAEAVGAADDDGPQRGLVGASAADDGVLVLGGVGGGALQLPLAVDGKDGLRGAAPRDLLDGADDAAAGAARRHHATDQEALLLQQLQELAGQAHAQRQGAAGPRQWPLHPEPPMRGPPGGPPGPGPGGPWAAPPQGRVVVPAGLSSVGRGGVDPRDEAMDAYTSAVAAAVQQQHHQQHQQHQRHLHQQLQLQQHLAAGRRDGAGAAGGRGPRGRPGMPERPLSSGGLGGTHAGMPGAVVMLGGGPRGGDGASPLLIGRRGGDMLGLPLGLDGGGSGAMPRFSGPLHGMAAAAARGRFSPYDSPNAEHHHQHQQQLSEPAEQLLQRLQAGRAGGTLRLQQPGPGGDGRRMAAPMYGRPPGAAVGGGGGGGGGGSLSAHDGTGIYTTSGRTSSQPTYGASYSTHGSRGRDERGRAAGEAAFAGPSSSHGPFDRLGGISSSGAQGLGGLGSVMPLLGSGLSGLPPAGGVAPADDSPSGSGSGGGAARLGGPGGELDAATGADPALTRQRSGVTREFSAVTNLVGLGLQEALAIVRQRQGPHS